MPLPPSAALRFAASRARCPARPGLCGAAPASLALADASLMDLRDALDGFVQHLRQRSEPCLGSAALAPMGRWARRWAGRSAASLTSEDILDHFADMLARGFKRRDLQAERALLTRFCRWVGVPLPLASCAAA